MVMYGHVRGDGATAMTFDPLEHVTPQVDLDALARLGRMVGSLGAEAVEVGSWVGGTRRILAQHFGRVYCVDTFEGTASDRIGEVADRLGKRRVLDTFCRNAGPHLMHSIVPIVGSSADWARRWPRTVDLVFLDADHGYEPVKADIAAWRPRRPAGRDLVRARLRGVQRRDAGGRRGRGGVSGRGDGLVGAGMRRWPITEVMS